MKDVEGTMKDVVSRIQRELPDTDKDRYDVAYERGRTQARSGLLLGGMVFGAIAGVAATFLLDPVRGSGRRAELASRAMGMKNDLTRVAGGRIEDLQNRAKGAAIETGIRKPEDFADTPNGSIRSASDRQFDPDAPGALAADPLTPEELETYGAAGPVAGAATAAANEEADRDRG
jgi:gas vesicle protein